MEEKRIYLTREQVMSWGQFKAYTFNKLRRTDPNFPKPVNFGERQLRWNLDELEKWAKGREAKGSFLSEKDDLDSNATEWIYLPGRTKTNEADRKTWVMKTGRTITVAVNGTVSPGYTKSLVEFCAMHGKEVPASGERISFPCLTAEEIVDSFTEKGLTIRETVSILMDEKQLQKEGFGRSESDEIKKALVLALERAGKGILQKE